MSTKCPYDNINNCLVWWAWAALWDKTKAYYLPQTILNGITQSGRVVVDKLGDIVIADTGAVPISAPDGKNITAEFTNNVIHGFDSITNNGFTYDYQSTSFSAVIGFTNLSVVGNYSAQLASGALGCALNTVKGITGGSFRAAAVARDASGDMDLADSYRDSLLDHPMGRVFVTSYYQNNEILNSLFQNANVQATWNEYQTGNESSQYYMDHVATALQPENRDTMMVTVTPNGSAGEGQPSYFDLHGLYMSTYLSTLSGRYGDHFNGQGDVETAQQYWKSASDTLAFRAASESYTGKGTAAFTGSTIQTNVQSASDDAINEAQAQLNQPAGGFTGNPTPSASFVALADGEFDLYTQVRQAAQAAAQAVDITAELEKKPVVLEDLDDFSIHGGYTITLPFNFSVTLSGTLVFDTIVTAAITAITAQNPQIMLALEPKDGFIFNDLEKAKTGTIASLLSAQIVQKLNSDQVRSYLTERMNDALAQRFGSIQPAS